MPDATSADILVRLRTALAGRYRVERELGRGGMATVFLARDLANDRDVAIKVLDPDLAAATPADRFLREIRTAAALQHPLILPLFESGQTDGLLFYVMPFVDGPSLRDRLRQERQLPVPAALRIARDVADALTYAHSRGIVHRDIKPENIMLVGDHALVADFGIARALESSEDQKLTATGIAIGTPMYMSPEQATGDTKVDSRTDIYALGCVVYEMLAGEAPFSGPTLQAVIARHVSQAPPPLRVVRPNVPEGVQLAIEKALAKVPADRFAVANEFAQALERAEAPPPGSGTWPTATGRWRREAVLWRRAVAVVGAAAVLGAGWFSWLRTRSSSSLEPFLLAIAPFNVLDDERNLTLWREGLVDLLSQALNGAGPLRTVPPSAVLRGWRGNADELTVKDLGQRTHAGLSVWGSLTRIGADSVKLSANTYDVANRQSLGPVEVRGHVNEMGAVADSCALKVLRVIGSYRGVGVVHLASVQGTTLPALKAYLQGEQFFRRTAWDSAQGYYERSADLDTTFALALHRLYLVRLLRASGQDSLIWRVALRAGSLNRGLAPRDSLAVAADSLLGAILLRNVRQDSLYFHLHQRLFATLDASKRRFPRDPQIWFQQGFAQFRLGGTAEATPEQILAAFDQAIALDSAFAPAYAVPIELAMELKGERAARHYINAYVALNPPGLKGDAIRLVAKLMDPKRARSREVQQTLDTASAVLLYGVQGPLSFWFDSAETMVRITGLIADGRDVSQLSQNSRFARNLHALVLGWRGHAREAYTQLQGLSGTAPLSLLAAIGGVPRDSAAAVLGRAVNPRPRDISRLEAPLAWWSIMGDTLTLRQVESAADSSLRAARSAIDAAHAQYVANGTRAYILLARHDSSGALARLMAMPDSLCLYCFLDRLNRVRLLIALGRNEEAARRLDVRVSDSGLPIDPLWRFERGRVAQRLGNKEKAIASYLYVVNAWARADPQLQPIVGEARSALRQLGYRTPR